MPMAGPVNAELLTTHAAGIAATLDVLADLHVGQVLRTDDRLVITDFDGNPVLAPADPVLPVPAAVARNAVKSTG